MGIWNEIHKARLKPKHETVTCEDCGAEFPIRTEEQRERLGGGCPECGQEST